MGSGKRDESVLGGPAALADGHIDPRHDRIQPDVGHQIPLKVCVTIRLDADIVGFFKSQGPGYQTRINGVLRAYMEAQRASERLTR